VEYFLAGKIRFAAIFSVVARMLDRGDFPPLRNLDDVQEAIARARAKTIETIESRGMK